MSTLIVTESGAQLRHQGGRVVVELEGRVLQRLPEEQVERVLLLGRVHLTSGFLELALRRPLPVAFLTQEGEWKGRLDPGGGRDVALRLAQFQRLTDLPWRLSVGRRLVRAKLCGQRAVLRRALRNHPDPELPPAIGRLEALVKELEGVENLPMLMGKEGAAARCYFQVFPRLLRPRPPGCLQFAGRSRRPPRDSLNALLSLGYGLLTAELTAVLSGLGLDPQIGVFHSSRGRMPALAQDLLEVFRAPVSDGLALSLANLGIVEPGDFETGPEGGVFLKKEALAAYFRQYRRRMTTPFRDRDGTLTTMRRQLHQQAAALRRELLGQGWYEPLVLPEGGPDRGTARRPDRANDPN